MHMVADALPRAIRRDAARTFRRFAVDILSADQRALAASTWRALEASIGAGIADSWDWVETWLAHYGEQQQHCFAVANGPDGPRGLALLVAGVEQRRGPFPVRTLHLGTAGEPDSETVRVQYNRPLVAPTDRAAFVDGLLRACGRVGFPYDELVLDGFTPEEISPFLSSVSRFRQMTLPCYATDLHAIRTVGKPVHSAFRGDTGKKIRRSHRRLEEQYGPVEVEVAETLAQAETIFDELIALHQSRWTSAGQPGKFASDRFTGFHRDLIRRLFPKGQILMVRVTAGETTVGCDYNLLEHGRVLAYQWGLGQFEDTRISPGLVTSVAVMQTALDRGFDEHNWLSGDVFYKRQLSTISHELTWAFLPHGVRGHLVDYTVRARQYMKARAENKTRTEEGQESGED